MPASVGGARRISLLCETLTVFFFLANRVASCMERYNSNKYLIINKTFSEYLDSLNVLLAFEGRCVS